MRSTLYVATDGDDRAAGSRKAPLATVAEAQRRVRTLRRKRAGRIEVRIGGGLYELPETWSFGPEDSGTPDAPVVYAAAGGEQPVLSGGRRIANWQGGEVNGKACWIADLPDVRSGTWRFTQLFVNGRRRPRTRWPREGYSRFAGFAGEADNALEWHQGPRKAEYHAGDFDPAWRNPEDIELFALQLWFDMHFRVKAVDAKQRTLTFNGPAVGSLRDETGKPARYYAENIAELVREPGDWYVDNSAGRLYYIPLPGQTPDNTEVVAPRLRTLLAVRGRREGLKARHIRFENLHFRHCDYELPADCTGYVQAAYGIPGAIVLEDAEACVLYGCSVSRVAQYGIEILAGGSNNRVVACDIHDTGAGGIKLGHETHALQWGTATERTPRRKPVPPAQSVVSDCSIHDGGVLYPSAIGIWIGLTGRNRILHNHIFNLNYTGISCGWCWGYADTPASGNRIAYNHIHHINHRRILSDNGGIYTLGVQPGTRVVGNVLHDIDCYGYGGWGIYPDEGSSEMLFENNLVHHTKAGSFAVHYGRDNICRNNIFALAGSQVVNLGKAENHRNGVFERNIVYWDKGGVEATAPDWDRNNYCCRDNLFYSADGAPPLFNGAPAAQLQAQGQHLGLVHADPLFAAPAAGNFTLRGDSPALATGFRPFDPVLAGPRLAGRRPTSFAAWPHDRREAPEPQVRLGIVCDTGGVTRERGGGYRVSTTLTAHNVGGRPARGRVDLAAFCDAGAARLDITRQDVRLAPGARLRRRLVVRVPAGTRSVRVEGEPSGTGLPPVCLVVNLLQAFPLQVPTLADAPPVAELAERLSGLLALPLVGRGGAGGQVRLARVPSGLAVWIAVEDHAVRPLPAAPWSGSGIELFVGPERPDLDDRSINSKLLGQIYLLPAASGAKAMVARQEYDKIAAKPGVPVWSRTTASGYEVAALVPMALLKLADDAAQWRLEIVAHAAADASGRARAFSLFGAGYPAGNVLDYGHVRAEDNGG